MTMELPAPATSRRVGGGQPSRGTPRLSAQAAAAPQERSPFSSATLTAGGPAHRVAAGVTGGAATSMANRTRRDRAQLHRAWAVEERRNREIGDLYDT